VAQLSVDVKSNFNNKVYGHKGDCVKVISKRGVVYVVEDINGKRFPVHESKISEANGTIEKELTPDKNIQNQVQVASIPPRTKPVPINQPTLF
jgi:hypothetical protein